MVDLTLTISVITKLDKPEKAEVQIGLKKKKAIPGCMLLKETHFKYRHRQQAGHIESKKESKKLVWLILK